MFKNIFAKKYENFNIVQSRRATTQQIAARHDSTDCCAPRPKKKTASLMKSFLQNHFRQNKTLLLRPQNNFK